MQTSSVSHRLPAHPHQLEVQEFDSYSLIVDLRGEALYDEDHLPEAVSVPWAQDTPGTLVTGDPMAGSITRVAAEEALAPLPYALAMHVERLEPGAAVLLYCDRGGRDSHYMAQCLMQRGFSAKALPGGWDNYRRWVSASIEVLPRVLGLRWIRSPPGPELQVIIDVLHNEGQQVLSLASIHMQRLCPGLSLPGDVSLSQPALETALVDALRRMDPSRVVWVDEVLAIDNAHALPASLRDALHHAPALRLKLNLAQRVGALQAHLEAQSLDTASLTDALGRVVPAAWLPGLEEVKALAAREGIAQALEGLVSNCVDRLYGEFAPPGRADRECSLVLNSLSSDDVLTGLLSLPSAWRDLLEPEPD